MREQTVCDLNRLYEIYSGKNMIKYTEGLHENPDEEFQILKSYENIYQLYGYGIWAVCLKQNDLVIGRAGLENREINGKIYLELGYVIDESFQKKGYAYEACSAICEFAKKNLYANELICLIDRENIASIRLAKKLGFKHMDTKNSAQIVEINGGKIQVYHKFTS